MAKIGFTTKDLLLLEEIERNIKEKDWRPKCARSLRVTPNTIKIRLHRMRKKFEDAQAFSKAYKQWRERLFRKSGGKWRHL